MRFLDCFTYFNEKEILELRIKLLYNVVDKFIISEGDYTHRGNSKQYSCEETFKQLKLPTDKVEFVKVKMPSFDEEPNPYVRETMQRDVFKHYVTKNDTAHISDCDEILNPDFVKKYLEISKKNPDKIVRPLYDFLCYSAKYIVCTDDNTGPIAWTAAFFATKHHLDKYSPSIIREQHGMMVNQLDYTNLYVEDENRIWEPVGWHFSWMGDDQRRKTKASEFLHWNEISLKENYDPEKDKFDLLGREMLKMEKYPIQQLPKIIFELEHVRRFLFAESI